MSRQTIEWTESQGNRLKELIDKFDQEQYSFYQHGDFQDMCAGPHVRYSKKIKHFKITHMSGAYWQADEKSHAHSGIRCCI